MHPRPRVHAAEGRGGGGGPGCRYDSGGDGAAFGIGSIVSAKHSGQ